MRNEIRNQGLMIFLAFTLILAIVAVQFRLTAAADEADPVNPRSPFTLTNSEGESITVVGTHGSIRTRDGEVVFDGKTTKYAPFYPVVGNVLNHTHLSQATLAYHYAEELKPESLGVLIGLRNYKADSGMQMATTLLPGPLQQAVYDSFGDYHGALFAYNYLTGEIYYMLSIPAAQSGPEDDGHLINRVRSVYTPGSTMKIVTLVCALTQNPELQNYTYTCTGSHAVTNGKPVTCGAAHGGPLTMSDAIGHSCNCYFASLIEQLDVDQTCNILDSLGIDSLGHYGQGSINKITYKKGIAEFSNNTSTQQIWKLIGQGSEVSLIDMARMAGAIANGGSSATPYLVESIYNPNEEAFVEEAGDPEFTELVSPSAAALLKPMWTRAVDRYYGTRLDPRVTMAKTGTAEYKDSSGEEYHNRLLLGVVEEYHTAFMLVVEHLPSGNPKIYDIANALVAALDAANLH